MGSNTFFNPVFINPEQIDENMIDDLPCRLKSLLFLVSACVNLDYVCPTDPNVVSLIRLLVTGYND